MYIWGGKGAWYLLITLYIRSCPLAGRILESWMLCLRLHPCTRTQIQLPDRLKHARGAAHKCIMHRNITHPLHESLEEAQDLVGWHSRPYLRTHAGVKTCNLQRSQRSNGAPTRKNKILRFSAAIPQTHRKHSGRRAKRTLA